MARAVIGLMIKHESRYSLAFKGIQTIHFPLPSEFVPI
jgi:hypothetical protein